MEGFIVLDYQREWAEARKQLAQWLDEGKIQRKETVIKGGLKNAEQALVDLYKGINTGEYKYLVFGPLDYNIPHILTASLGKLIVEIKNPQDTSKL
jgi:hypothetical protein